MRRLAVKRFFSSLQLKKTSYYAIFIIYALSISIGYGKPTVELSDTAGVSEQGYRIEKPGTITFTVGVKISGKVEKPQVMIFLPKEKTLYREEIPDRSFTDELSQPLPYTPLIPQPIP